MNFLQQQAAKQAIHELFVDMINDAPGYAKKFRKHKETSTADEYHKVCMHELNAMVVLMLDY